MHLFHKWAKWELRKANYSSPLFPMFGQWSEYIQTRSCEKCGKLKVRNVT